MPKFSIIVPIYNIQRFLDYCIQSILAQTYLDYELILVDDGSSDLSGKMCDFYAKKNVQIKVIHKNNGGLVSARQAGVAEASGEYVACIDGDDWIRADYLEKFSVVINQYNPDIICSGYRSIFKDMQVQHSLSFPLGYYGKKQMEEIFFPNLIESDNGRRFPTSLWAKVFRREIYQHQQQLVDIYINIGEDIACVSPTIFSSNSMFLLPDCMYFYRQNPNSMTKNKKAFDWEGPKRIGQHLEKQIDMSKFDFQYQVYRFVVHNLYNICVSQFNKSESYWIISKCIKEILKDPYYKNAIEHCRYKKYTKNIIALYLLRHSNTIMMCLYNSFKKIKKY